MGGCVIQHVDVTGYLNELNRKLQKQGQLVD
jgi:hypothetical protein